MRKLYELLHHSRLASKGLIKDIISKFAKDDAKRKNVVVIGTTTNDRDSSSWELADLVVREIKDKVNLKIIDANELHIIKNLSCYSSDGKQCADPKAGKYRCWAHKHGEEEPEKYGGKDEMPVIYDAIEWADYIIWVTSTRWGSHSAILQNIIERMNTLENRHTVYGEPNPLAGKSSLTIVTGQHWRSQEVAEHLQTVWNLYGFNAEPEWTIVWQRTIDMNEEQVGSNKKILIKDYKNSNMKNIIKKFTNYILI
jgi:multimeric flavodoxin WrbA